MLLEITQTQETHLHDTDSAFFAYTQALRESPNALELHDDLRRLAGASDNWESYADVLQDVVEQVLDEVTRRDLLMEIGGVYRDRLEAPEQSLEFFNQVIALEDGHSDALDALEGIYRVLGQHDQLIGVYDRKLEAAGNPGERKSILLLLGHLWRDDLEDNAEAENVYRAMLDEFPEDTAIHGALCEIYLAERKDAELRQTLEIKRDILIRQDAPAQVLADLECQLGMLSYSLLRASEERAEEAVPTALSHYEAALHQVSNHEETVTRLEELLADRGARGRVTRLLEPIYEAAQAWEKLGQVVEIQYQEATKSGQQSRQLNLLKTLAAIYSEYLQESESSWQTYGRIIEMAPDDHDARDSPEVLTSHLERWSLLTALYARIEDEPSQPDARIAIKLTLARTWHEPLGDPDRALAFYHKVLEEAPDHAEALDALQTLYGDLDRAEDLLDIYRRRIDLATDDGVKLDYLFRTVDILSDRLERFDDAIETTEEALSIRPGHLPAIERLDRL